MMFLRVRPRFSLALSVAVAGGTVIAIAASDRPRALWRTAGQLQPIWLLVALAAELLAYAGYVLAYRSIAAERGGPRLPLMLTVRIVLAGFGPFVPLGGFAFDRLALSSVRDDARSARVQVLGLGVIEYLLLAPAAWVCALILFFGTSRASPWLTLPWIVAVPPGFLLGWWLTHPQLLAELGSSGGRVRLWIWDVLSGVGVMREVVLHPRERAGALIGMAVYWAAEIACFGYALRCFGVHIGLPALIVAYGTGYAASRRSLPLGGAGITEALLTVSLIAVHVNAVHALFGVIAYRLVNFIVPMFPGLFAHASLTPLLQGSARRR